jgi:crossover junction endodeoxyribonuclease RuvC
MRILGIDPGIARTGYGVVDAGYGRQQALDFGCLETAADLQVGARLEIIHAGIRDLIERWQPEALAIERLFFNTNVTTAFTAAEARGVAILAAQQCGVPQFDYTPLQAKQAITGYGRADKRQMQEMVRVLLNLRETPRPDDVADALALALAHAQGAPIRKQAEARSPAQGEARR